MKPSLWAEIHRLNDVEHLSQRLIAQRLACGRDTVKRALTMPQPPQQYPAKKPRSSKLDPYKKTIQELLITYPKLTGVRVEEEAVLGAGVVLTASTPIVDVTGPEPVEYRGRVPARAVVIPGMRPKEFPAGSYPVPCALIIGRRKESTDRKTSLNDVLRQYGIPT